METLRDGTFTFRINSAELSRGLRPSKRNPRDSRFLIQCEGAVALDGILQVIDDLENDRIDTSVIVDAFPYPQIFVFTNLIIVCGREDIYEWDGAALTLKLSVTAGNLWSAVDFYEFIYMTNGTVAVLRDAFTGVYSTTSDQPVAEAACNFNGQVILGGLID